MNRAVAGSVVTLLLAGLQVLGACKAASPGEVLPIGEANMKKCFEESAMDLGVPNDAVFYMAEVDDGFEPQANKRWYVGVDGAVRYCANGDPFDRSRLSGEPFNRPFLDKPIARVPLPELRAFQGWLTEQGFLTMPGEVGPPEGLTVSGGADLWVVARLGDRVACVRLRPGAPFADVLNKRFDQLVEPHMRR